MNIVINTRSVSERIESKQNDFVNGYLLEVIDTHPKHSFFFIGDSVAGTFLKRANCSIIANAPKQGNGLLWKIWYSYKLPALLKKYKADVFVNPDGICSLKTSVPQCVLLPDISFAKHPSVFKKNVPAYLEKAAIIVTFSEYAKIAICREYPKISPEKVSVLYTVAPKTFLAAEWKENENTKKKYTEGREYFLFTGELDAENNLVNLLKAFSFFKKRQKSNMQLVIASKKNPGNNAFTESLKTYKYRNDVKLITLLTTEELVAITAAAYAFVYTVQQTGFYAPVLQAMQSGVPVIVSNTVVMTEICGDAALFADPAVFENIADKMMLLFKDEGKLNEMIALGKQQAAVLSAVSTSELFWQNIVKCSGIPL